MPCAEVTEGALDTLDFRQNRDYLPLCEPPSRERQERRGEGTLQVLEEPAIRSASSARNGAPLRWEVHQNRSLRWLLRARPRHRNVGTTSPSELQETSFPPNGQEAHLLNVMYRRAVLSQLPPKQAEDEVTENLYIIR